MEGISNITVWYMKDNYKCTLETNTTVYFQSLRDNLEIAYYDTITSTLYFNDMYKGRFNKAKKQIVKDFKPDHISRYLNLGDL